MAFHLTYTQRFRSFCDLTESTINTNSFGKRKVQSSSVIENLNYNQKELSISAINNVKSLNFNRSQSCTSCNTNNRYENEITLKRDDNIAYQNGFHTSNEESEESDSEWEYYSDEESEIGTENEKITKDPWSPYLKDVTFDINNYRDSKVFMQIETLKKWIEDVSNIENSNILLGMNNFYHQQYPLCTMSKNELRDSMTPEEKSLETLNKEEQKEGTFIEYVRDDKTDYSYEIHIANYCNGVLHGFYRIFTASSNNGGNEFTQFHSLGRFMNGKKVGMSWKWLEGNCYFIDLEGEEDDNMARDGYYFYPNLSSGIHGKNVNIFK